MDTSKTNTNAIDWDLGRFNTPDLLKFNPSGQCYGGFHHKTETPTHQGDSDVR